jgi:hypothetical protein
MNKNTKTPKVNTNTAEWILKQLSKAYGTAWEYRSRQWLCKNAPGGTKEAIHALNVLESQDVIVQRTIKTSIIVYKLK